MSTAVYGENDPWEQESPKSGKGISALQKEEESQVAVGPMARSSKTKRWKGVVEETKPRAPSIKKEKENAAHFLRGGNN